MTKEIDEKAMLTSLAQGNRVAFTQVFNLYYSSVYSYARKYLRSNEEAEEATQDVFLNVWIYRKNLVHVDNFPTYIFSIKKHVMARRLKNLVLTTSLDEDKALHLVASGRADDEIRTVQVTKAYYHALDSLPPHQLRVYRMVKEEQMSYEQVSEELKISRDTVKFHMKEAYRLLRHRLKPFSPLVAFLAVASHHVGPLFRDQL